MAIRISKNHNFIPMSSFKGDFKNPSKIPFKGVLLGHNELSEFRHIIFHLKIVFPGHYIMDLDIWSSSPLFVEYFQISSFLFPKFNFFSWGPCSRLILSSFNLKDFLSDWQKQVILFQLFCSVLSSMLASIPVTIPHCRMLLWE